MRVRLCMLLVLAIPPAWAAQTRAEEPASSQPQYAAIFLDDVKVGYARQVRTATGAEVAHEMEQSLVIGRGNMTIAITVNMQTVETPQGRPLRFRHTMALGGGRQVVKSGLIADGQIHLSTQTAAGPQESVKPYPEGAMMPEAVQLLQREKGLAPGTKYSLLEFEPIGLTAVRQDIIVGRPVDVALIGRTARLVPLETVVHHGGMEIPGIAYADEQLNMLKAVFGMMGMRFTLVSCDEPFARGPNGQFDPLMITAPASPVAIADPRGVTAATYTLAPLDANRPLAVPTLDGQTVRTNADGTLTVQVRLMQPAPATRPATPPAAQPATQADTQSETQPGTRPPGWLYTGQDGEVLAALRPSEYVQGDHRAIQRQAARIVAQSADALEAARAIERWVNQHVNEKNLSVGYASALETLQTRTGDCSEHAVLTAALCRAAGIPCRLVLGVAYAEMFGDLKQRFIGHAWNQAYVGGRWITLDASLGADAARFVQLAGAEDPASFIGLMQSVGNVRVVQVQVESRSAGGGEKLLPGDTEPVETIRPSQ